MPNTPLYPFGYGLSYTTFDYGDVRLSASEMTADGSIEATVRLTNSGRRDGVEVVQLYIRDRVRRPVPCRSSKASSAWRSKRARAAT